MNDVIIYCDGGCRGNQQKENVGGWGVILIHGTRTMKLYGGELNYNK